MKKVICTLEWHQGRQIMIIFIFETTVLLKKKKKTANTSHQLWINLERIGTGQHIEKTRRLMKTTQVYEGEKIKNLKKMINAIRN